MNRPWIAFFSQTGSEIVEVSKLLGRWPDLIITNERPEHLRKIHPALENKHLIFVDNKPSEEELFPTIAETNSAFFKVSALSIPRVLAISFNSESFLLSNSFLSIKYVK